MNTALKSTIWAEANEHMRKCHLTAINPASAKDADWTKTFSLLVAAIKDERKFDPAFASEMSELSDATGIPYDFKDIFEEYFDNLEKIGKYEDVIRSCDELVNLFKWEKELPSEYMYRKGNALEKLKKFDEAELFGEEWLNKYPYDLYAAASNVFIKIELGKIDEAEKITKKYLKDDLICDNAADTFYMAAYRLFEMTDDISAKQRIEERMAECSAMTHKKSKE